MSECFRKPKYLGANVKFELDLSNYATCVKNAAGVDTYHVAKKTDLANLKPDVDKLDTDKLKNAPTNLSNLKSKVDKLDVDKLVPVPVDLSKLIDLVKKHLVKKDVYNAKMKNIQYKIPDITNLATDTTINAKINEIKKEIPIIITLATTAALLTVENKILNVIDLVKKADYDAKISEMEKKYFTASDYKKFTSNTLDAKRTRKKLINEYDLNEKRKALAVKGKIKTLARQAELKIEQDKIVKLQTYELSLFIGQSYFSNDGAKLYLIFQPIYQFTNILKYFLVL